MEEKSGLSEVEVNKHWSNKPKHRSGMVLDRSFGIQIGLYSVVVHFGACIQYKSQSWDLSIRGR